MPARCFIAIDPPDTAVRALIAAQSAFMDAAPGWRGEKWVAPDLMHVTVAFLGAIPDPALGEVVRALSASVAAFPAFSLRLTGVRAVPGVRHATMLWAEMQADTELAPLRDFLLSSAGCKGDPRPFHPHITLVRARRPHRIDPGTVDVATEVLSEAGKAPDGRVSVRSLTLYASTLGATGPSYDALSELRLGG